MDRNPCYNKAIHVLRNYEPPHDKTNKMTVRPAKTQISLDIRPVWSESSLCVQLVAKDPSFLHADSEDSDQTGRMPRLILIRLGRCPGWSESSLGAHAILLVLSWGGSYIYTPLLAATKSACLAFKSEYNRPVFDLSAVVIGQQ